MNHQKRIQRNDFKNYLTASFTPEEIEEMIKLEHHEANCIIYVCTCTKNSEAEKLSEIKEKLISSFKDKLSKHCLTDKQEPNDFDLSIFDLGAEFGFRKAIELLRNVPDDNGGITKCIHSNEWAKYLERQLPLLAN